MNFFNKAKTVAEGAAAMKSLYDSGACHSALATLQQLRQAVGNSAGQVAQASGGADLAYLLEASSQQVTTQSGCSAAGGDTATTGQDAVEFKLEQISLSTLEPVADERCTPGVFQLFQERISPSQNLSIGSVRRLFGSPTSTQQTPSSNAAATTYSFCLVHVGLGQAVLRTSSISLAIAQQRRINKLDGELVQAAIENKLLVRLLQTASKHEDWPSIHLACLLCLQGYVDVAAHKSDPLSVVHTVTPNQGFYPIHLAAGRGHLHLVQRLLALGADPTKVDLAGRNTLHHIASASTANIGGGHHASDLLQSIRRHDAVGFNRAMLARDERCATPLVVALGAGNLPAIQTMIGLLKMEQGEGRMRSRGAGSQPQQQAGHLARFFVDCLLPAKVDPQCLDALLAEEPTLLEESELLHRTFQRELLSVVATRAPNSLNSQHGGGGNSSGRTPLQSAVARGDLSACVQLLAHGANADVREAGNMDGGGTALHIAAQRPLEESTLRILQLLLCFGADTEARDSRGRTVEDVAASGEVKALLRQFGKWTRAKEAFKARGVAELAEHFLGGMPAPRTLKDAIQQQLLKAQVAAISTATGSTAAATAAHEPRLLSLDGGGIRGLVLIQLLMELEERLGSPLLPNHFDWVAGTSTGAILALALADGTPLCDCLRLYLRLKDEVFQPAQCRPYDAQYIEHFLQQHFGTQRKMSELRHGGNGVRAVVTATRADVNPPEQVLLRSYDFGEGGVAAKMRGIQLPAPTQGLEPARVEIWKAARMSSAAPTYFPSFGGSFMDGGLIANNPSSDLLAELQTHSAINSLLNSDKGRGTASNKHQASVFPSNPLACLVSIGTGRIPQREVTDLDVILPQASAITSLAGVGDLTKLGGQLWKNLSALQNLKALLVEQVACSDGAVVERAQAMSHSMGAPFWRLTPQLAEEIALDTREDEKLVQLLWLTKVYANEECAREMEMLAAYLRVLGGAHEKSRA